MFKPAFLFSVLFVLSVPIALAQVTTVTISGTVEDESKGVLPGATVTVRNVDIGMTQTMLTNDQGRYHLANLVSGNYEVQVELTGFQTALRKGIQLAVGGSATVDMTLKVGEITQEVIVTDEAPLLNMASAETSGLFDSRQIRDLPLNGRDFIQLAGLQAGAVVMLNAYEKATSKGYGAKIAYAGVRPYQTQVMIDGGDVNTVQNFRTAASSSNVQLGVESVKEFQILVGNYGANVSSYGGAVVNAITRSGTNEFHGSGYWFLRNDNLDARNFFDPVEGPEFKRNQFGGSLGGPIIRNKTFFFYNYEGLRERLGLSKFGGVPTLDARQGKLPGRTVPVDSQIVPYLNLWPLPNGRDFGDGTAEFLWSFNEPTNEDYMVGKIDHAITDSDRITGRYTLSDADVLQARELPLFIDTRITRYQYFLLEERKIFSPALSNAVRFHLNRSRFLLGIGEKANIPQSLYQFPGKPFSTWSVPGLADIGPDNGSPRHEILNVLEFGDDVNYTRGNHGLKLGFVAKRYRFYKDAPFRPGSDYNFQTLDDFLRARPRVIAFQGLNSDSVRNLRQTLFALYFQDDAQVTRNLTLNLGVRWEFTTVPTEIDGKLSTLIHPETDKQFVTIATHPWFKNPSLAKKIAPRVGFAWDPSGQGKTAIRSGFGFYFDAYLPNYYQNPATRTPPFFERVEFNNPPRLRTLEAIALASPADILLAPSVTDYFPQSPHNIHFNLTMQHTLTPQLGLTLAYVGSRGIHLARSQGINTALPSQIVNGRKFFAAGTPRVNRAWGDTSTNSTSATSKYHSMQIRIERRSTEGLRFSGSYTLAKATDDASAVAGTDFDFAGRARAQDDRNHSADWALSVFDVRHSGVFNTTYGLPGFSGQPVARALFGNWQISGIVQLAAGSPITALITSSDYARNGGGSNQYRPDLKAGASNNPVLGGPDKYFDPGVFVLPGRGFFGNLGRNTIIGPRYIGTDLGAEKSFALKGEDTRLSLRVEVFNILNHANFAQPRNGAFTSSGPVGEAGRITRTVTSARQTQIALRIVF
ncbi:MAG: TonB-dependent receptor [Acidobacteria bacterium]|nr:TonB-dependent receptor [Acidobacteriota bacterium]